MLFLFGMVFPCLATLVPQKQIWKGIWILSVDLDRLLADYMMGYSMDNRAVALTILRML